MSVGKGNSKWHRAGPVPYRNGRSKTLPYDIPYTASSAQLPRAERWRPRDDLSMSSRGSRGDRLLHWPQGPPWQKNERRLDLLHRLGEDSCSPLAAEAPDPATVCLPAIVKPDPARLHGRY